MMIMARDSANSAKVALPPLILFYFSVCVCLVRVKLDSTISLKKTSQSNLIEVNHEEEQGISLERDGWMDVGRACLFEM